MNSRVGSNLFQAYDLFIYLIHSLWKVYLQIIYVVVKNKTDRSYSSASLFIDTCTSSAPDLF